MDNPNSKLQTSKYVFGPVPSRRLGRSLGVDLIPFKTCTFDCVYCQVGRTTCHDLPRREFVPLETVLAQIGDALRSGPRPDYLTLAGSGEPTLYLRLGELIDRIHHLTDVPVDIITNGSTLWMDEVFADVVRADLIIPSLDAGDEATFRRINRPVESITFDRLLAGLQRLSATCPEKVWLEVFLIGGINDDEAHVRRIAELTRRWNCAKVQLNTAVRPPAEKHVQMVPPDRLARLAELFTPRAEVIADFPASAVPGGFHPRAESVLAMLRRRPCTLADIAAGLGTAKDETETLIETLRRTGAVHAEIRHGREYYLADGEDPSAASPENS